MPSDNGMCLSVRQHVSVREIKHCVGKLAARGVRGKNGFGCGECEEQVDVVYSQHALEAKEKVCILCPGDHHHFPCHLRSCESIHGRRHYSRTKASLMLQSLIMTDNSKQRQTSLLQKIAYSRRGLRTFQFLFSRFR